MKRRQILTATAVATAATLGTAATASAAPGNGEHTPPGLAKKDTLAWAAGGVIEIGSAVAGGGHHTEQDYPTPMSEEIYRETLGREVTSLSAENQMKWDYLRPDRETFDFEDADEIMDFAQQHGQVVRGHTLLWHAQNPTWLEEGDFSADELRDLLKEHIDTVVGRYRGRIQQWDVVNEIFTDEGELRLNDNIWLRELGPGILADAFRWTRAADPDALLFFNDYNVDSVSAKSDAYYALITELLAEGVPIDGFSTQGHLSLRYDFPEDITENLQRFADLGLETAITELDVRMDLEEGATPTEQQLEQQADYYRRMTEAALSV